MSRKLNKLYFLTLHFLSLQPVPVSRTVAHARELSRNVSPHTLKRLLCVLFPDVFGIRVQKRTVWQYCCWASFVRACPWSHNSLFTDRKFLCWLTVQDPCLKFCKEHNYLGYGLILSRVGTAGELYQSVKATCYILTNLVWIHFAFLMECIWILTNYIWDIEWH